MPELPEVELGRQVLARAVDREIRAVDDNDEWVCRPHPPGQIAAALVGGRITAARRRGKAMWCETADRTGEPGPNLGVHLGMTGQIRVDDERGPLGPERFRDRATKPEWFRFTVVFADGGEFRLFDTRRLSRVRLAPDLDALGPDAEEISRDEFRERIGRGRAPLKARLLDQSVIAGVGNLLADEVLWQAAVSPARRVDEMDGPQLDAVHEALERSLKAAIAHGGVHTGEIIPFRSADAHCPRCGGEMGHGTVGGRSTWWCRTEQAG